MTKLSAEDAKAIRDAYDIFENPRFSVRFLNLLGSPLERLARLLPRKVLSQIEQASKAAIGFALETAVATLRDGEPAADQRGLNSGMVFVSGMTSGFFGGPALLIETPITTGIILRSIAGIARAEGEDLTDEGTCLACIEVFALGRRTRKTKASGTGYYTVRAFLAKSIADVERLVAERGLAAEGAPAVIRLIEQVARYFGVVVTEKAAAQAVPVAGAAGGALINKAFHDHFAETAAAHFAMRRLERTYGAELVQREYEGLKAQEDGAPPAERQAVSRAA